MATSASTPPPDPAEAGIARAKSVSSDPEARIHRQLLRFLLVGGVGFLVDLGAMTTLIYGFGLVASNTGLMSSRVLAWAAAITVAYFLNAKITFGASIRHSRFVNYLFIQAMGALINLGTFSALILLTPLSDKPLYAMVIGNVLAVVNNFLLVRKFVYRFHPEVDDPE